MEAVAGQWFFANAGLLAEALPDGVVAVDAAGAIVAVNSRFLAMTGHAETDLIGSSVDDLVPADRRASHVQHRTTFSARPVLRNMGAVLDTVCLRSDGSAFPVDIALAPLALDGETYVVATIRDATDREALEEARREREEEFRLLVESVSGLAIFMLDVQGRVTSWNSGAERLKGYARDEIIGRPLSVFYTPGDIAAQVPDQLLAEATAKGRAEAFGWRVRKDGSLFQASVSLTASVDGEGTLRGFTKITRDISAALQARDDIERLHLLEQREQLGRDLHDGAIQALFAVGMGLQALISQVEDPLITERLEQSVRALDDTITELRAFIFGLSNDLTPAQVRDQIDRLVSGVRARSGIEVTGIVEPEALAQLGSRGRHLLLVAREALSNVERHSRASSCTLSLRRHENDTIELLVNDDGCGFDPAATSRGLGLTNARVRAQELDAEYMVDSSPTGTTVTLRIPPSRQTGGPNGPKR